MSRAQDRSSGVPAGEQPTQPVSDTSGTSGTPGTSGSATGATGASMHDQPTTRTGSAATGTTTSYARGTGTSAGYARGRSDTDMGDAGLGGVISMVAGLLAFFTGLSAVVKQSFFTSLPDYAYRWNVHGWGWVLLVLGALLFAAGAIQLLGMGFGKLAAVGLAVLTAVVGFLFLPYTPIWGTIVVALSAFAIWASLRDGSSVRDADGGSGYGSGYGESTTGGTGSTGSTGSMSGSTGGPGSMGSGPTTTSRSTRI
jgi:hypothetical protein